MSSASPPPSDPQFSLADRLWKSRDLAGLSQTELAERTGISRQSISNYENGRTVPGKLQLRAWALACGVRYEWLTGDCPPRRRGGGLGAAADARDARAAAVGRRRRVNPASGLTCPQTSDYAQHPVLYETPCGTRVLLCVSRVR